MTSDPLKFHRPQPDQPVTQQDVDDLRLQMEQLRDAAINGKRLEEDNVWPLVDQASDLLDRAKDGEFETQLNCIYGLLSAIWATTRSQARLRKALGNE